MNKHYHALVPGWNWWYLGLALLLIFMFFMGWRNIAAVARTDRQTQARFWVIKRTKYRQELYWILAALGGIAIGIMVLLESGTGIAQLLQNLTGLPCGDFVIVLVCTPVVMFVTAFLLYTVAIIAEQIKVAFVESNILYSYGEDQHVVSRVPIFNEKKKRR